MNILSCLDFSQLVPISFTPVGPINKFKMSTLFESRLNEHYEAAIVWFRSIPGLMFLLKTDRTESRVEVC